MGGYVVENGKIVEDASLTTQEAVELRETVAAINDIEEDEESNV